MPSCTLGVFASVLAACLSEALADGSSAVKPDSLLSVVVRMKKMISRNAMSDTESVGISRSFFSLRLANAMARLPRVGLGQVPAAVCTAAG